jgi:hypothetical protein
MSSRHHLYIDLRQLPKRTTQSVVYLLHIILYISQTTPPKRTNKKKSGLYLCSMQKFEQRYVRLEYIKEDSFRHFLHLRILINKNGKDKKKHMFAQQFETGSAKTCGSHQGGFDRGQSINESTGKKSIRSLAQTFILPSQDKNGFPQLKKKQRPENQSTWRLDLNHKIRNSKRPLFWVPSLIHPCTEIRVS